MPEIHVSIDVGEHGCVSGLLRQVPSAKAVYVLAHGAGAGIHHPFLSKVASGLASLGIASLRYQFPYMESGSRRPDRPPICHATVRAAVSTAAAIAPGLVLVAGGKSFGGRMTSQAQAAEPLPGVCGLVFLGFPLHPPRKPSASRAEHLAQVNIPMLFLQGERDEFAQASLLCSVVSSLAPRARLVMMESADHSLHVPSRSGRTDDEVLRDALETLASWIDSIRH